MQGPMQYIMRYLAMMLHLFYLSRANTIALMPLYGVIIFVVIPLKKETFVDIIIFICGIYITV